jgi:hypothetical protein
MLYAGGAKFILLSALLYTPGTILFIIAKREQSRTVFTPVEWLNLRGRRRRGNRRPLQPRDRHDLDLA